MAATRYEIRYESATGGGTRFVLADTDEQALATFSRDWSEHGDPAPSHWIVARWAIG